MSSRKADLSVDSVHNSFDRTKRLVPPCLVHREATHGRKTCSEIPLGHVVSRTPSHECVMVNRGHQKKTKKRTDAPSQQAEGPLATTLNPLPHTPE